MTEAPTTTLQQVLADMRTYLLDHDEVIGDIRTSPWYGNHEQLRMSICTPAAAFAVVYGRLELTTGQILILLADADDTLVLDELTYFPHLRQGLQSVLYTYLWYAFRGLLQGDDEVIASLKQRVERAGYDSDFIGECLPQL